MANSYTYTSRERDKESNLYFYRARYYDASIGRFLQTDSIGLAGGINLYSYVGNNPIIWIDPWGLIEVKGVTDDPIYVHPNDPDPFPSDPHGHVGGPNSKTKVDINTGEIYEGTRGTGKKISKKKLKKLKKVLKKAGILGTLITIGDVVTSDDLGEAIEKLIGGDELGDMMIDPETGALY